MGPYFSIAQFTNPPPPTPILSRASLKHSFLLVSLLPLGLLPLNLFSVLVPLFVEVFGLEGPYLFSSHDLSLSDFTHFHYLTCIYMFLFPKILLLNMYFFGIPDSSMDLSARHLHS
jgi:hypothetical protein